MSRARQRGVALLVAIVMFALATTVAAAITYSKAMAARRAAATFTLEQALQAGMAAEALAGIALEDDGGSAAHRRPTRTGRSRAAPLEIEGTGVWIQAQLEDLQRPLQPQQRREVERRRSTPSSTTRTRSRSSSTLLGIRDIDERYADLLVDWIDPDIAPYGSQGGEDTLYLSQTPPYRPPNTFITHTSELLALPGFGAENYREDRALRHRAAERRDGQRLHRQRHGARCDPQRSAEPAPNSPLQDLKALREKGLLSRLQPAISTASPIRHLKTGRRAARRREILLVPPAHATFVLALRSSFCTVFSSARPTNKVRTVQRSFGSE